MQHITVLETEICLRTETSFILWVELNRFRLKTGKESSLPKASY
jgi:hypothetical protein